MLSVTFDPAALEQAVERIAGAAQEAVRPAAQAAAQVLYEEARRRAPVAGAHVGKGGKLYPGGALKASIYQVFSQERSHAAGAGYDRVTYHVSWNAAKAPHGHLIEFGHWQTHRVVKTRAGRFITLKSQKLPAPRWVPAQPFIRPAFDARIAEALRAAEAEFARRVGGAA